MDMNKQYLHEWCVALAFDGGHRGRTMNHATHWQLAQNIHRRDDHAPYFIIVSIFHLGTVCTHELHPIRLN